MNRKKMTKAAMLAVDTYFLIKQVKKISTDIKMFSETEDSRKCLK